MIEVGRRVLEVFEVAGWKLEGRKSLLFYR